MSSAEILTIQVHVQRITTEHAYVSVPFDDAILDPPDASGRRGVNPAKVFAVALDLGVSPETHWEMEDAPRVDIHPIQGRSEDIG